MRSYFKSSRHSRRRLSSTVVSFKISGHFLVLLSPFVPPIECSRSNRIEPDQDRPNQSESRSLNLTINLNLKSLSSSFSILPFHPHSNMIDAPNLSTLHSSSLEGTKVLLNLSLSLTRTHQTAIKQQSMNQPISQSSHYLYP